MTRRLGFVGTGAITSAIVRGLKDTELGEWPIVVSPRNPERAAELARALPGVRVAASNQAVVDQSDIVFLAVRPQDAEMVIRPLSFGAAQSIISLIAATGIDAIRSWTGVANITLAIPLTFVEQRSGVTPIMPPDETAAQIFRALGGCIQLSDLDAFDAYAAASALMSTYFGMAEVACEWLMANGLRAEDSDLYLRNLFGSLGDVLRAKPLPLTELRISHATRGGLNELAHMTFVSHGGAAALKESLAAVLSRIHSQRAQIA